MEKTLIVLFTLAASMAFANDLSQAYEKAYFLETAKGQTEEALEIYRKIAAIPATDENRESILLALSRLEWHYRFTKKIPVKIGATKLTEGDHLEILEVLGAKTSFEVGGTYLVRGAYTLASRDEASLALYVSQRDHDPKVRTSGSEHVTLKKGSGTFEVSVTFGYEGWPHISLYPAAGGQSFGMAYFGEAEWLRTKPFTMAISLQSKVDSFDMKRGDLKNIKKIFGTPTRYLFGKESFDEDDLPAVYIIDYADGFRILMNNRRIEEFRFEGKPLYTIGGITRRHFA